MKKSNKKIPKTHLPKFDRGGSSRASSDTTRTMYSGSEEAVTGNTQGSGGGMNSAYNEGRQSKINAGQYAQYAAIASNAGMQFAENQNSDNGQYTKSYNNGQIAGDTITQGLGTINPLIAMGTGIRKSATAIVGDKQGANRTASNWMAAPHESAMKDATAFNSAENDSQKFGSVLSTVGDITGMSKMRQMFSYGTGNDEKTSGFWGKYNDLSGISSRNNQQNNMQAESNQYAMGGTNAQPNAEIELTEGTNNAGSIREHDLPSHENATSKNQKYLPPATRILSTRLKNPLTGKPFSDETVNTKKAEKTLNDPNASPIAKKRANLDVLAANILFDRSYAVQEALKQAKVEAYAKKMGVTLPQAQEAPEEGMQFPMGGVKLPMYPLGGPTDNTKFTPAQRQQAYADSMTLYKSGFNKNIPNWQAEPGFNDAVGRLHTLNGVVPQSTDKSATAYANDPNYLAKRSVPYAKPTRPVYEVKTEGKNAFVPTYPNYNMPMKGLERPDDFNPQLQTVPANRPSTIKTNIVTGPTMSYKEYKQGNEVLDRAYFDPSTKKEIEIQGFKYGGKKLPKYYTGGESEDDLTPEQLFLKTKFMGAEQNQRNLAFNKMTGNMNPGYNTQKSAWSPEELQASSDEMVSESYPEKASTTPLNQPETYPIRKDKNGKLLFDTPTSKSNIGSPKVTDPNDKNFDWGKLKTVGQNYGNFALQNAGNIYDLTRKKDPLQKYDRATAKFLDPSSAIRDALAQTRRAEYNVRGASGGNAGTYLSNRVALNAQNTENLARIHQNYQNANAQISNQNSQFNTEIAYREAEAQAKDRAMRQNVDSQAIHSMASNFGKMSKSSKQDNMEQKELDMFMYRYKNEPGFKEQVDKFRTA